MIREKVIAITLTIVSSIVLIESIAALSTEHDLFLENSVQENRNLNGIIEDKNSSPALLQVNSWGEDIFYDRSNIYNITKSLLDKEFRKLLDDIKITTKV